MTVQHNTPVEAGIVKNLISKLGSLFSNLIKNLGNFGESDGKELSVAYLSNAAFSIEDKTRQDEVKKQIESAGNDPSKWPDEYTLVVRIKFTGSDDNKEIADIYLKKKGTSDSEGFVEKDVVFEYRNPNDDKEREKVIEEVVTKVAEKYDKKFFGEEYGFEDVQAIKASVNLTLHKIVSADEIDIRLVSINSAYDIDTTNSIIDQLVDNPEFVDALPENEPASYNVFPEEDDYDIEECEECCVDMSQCIFNILKPLYKLYYDCMYFSWNAKGPNYMSVVALAETYNWMAKDAINRLSEYHYGLFCYAPHPATFATDGCCVDCQDAVTCMQGDITNLVNAIDLFYCDFNGPIQQYLMDLKCTFEHELNYTLARFNG